MSVGSSKRKVPVGSEYIPLLTVALIGPIPYFVLAGWSDVGVGPTLF